ncbi:hypothetical protein ACFV6G_25170 [Streptomyces lavendulae]|uniref:hypothetical protein n=1 Tax=Streptomyces lavendulae TaxID=1914 RepID=UPI0036D072AB
MHARFDTLPDDDTEAGRTARALRERPGDWAHISDHDQKSQAANLAYRIRQGKLRAFRPAGAFEATSRTTDGTSGAVWARYVGTPEAASPVGLHRGSRPSG